MASSHDRPDSSAPQPATLSPETKQQVDAEVDECHKHFRGQINRHLEEIFARLGAARADARARLIQSLPQRFPADEREAIVAHIEQTFSPNLESFTYRQVGSFYTSTFALRYCNELPLFTMPISLGDAPSGPVRPTRRPHGTTTKLASNTQAIPAPHQPTMGAFASEARRLPLPSSVAPTAGETDPATLPAALPAALPATRPRAALFAAPPPPSERTQNRVQPTSATPQTAAGRRSRRDHPPDNLNSGIPTKYKEYKKSQKETHPREPSSKNRTKPPLKRKREAPSHRGSDLAPRDRPAKQPRTEKVPANNDRKPPPEGATGPDVVYTRGRRGEPVNKPIVNSAMSRLFPYSYVFPYTLPDSEPAFYILLCPEPECANPQFSSHPLKHDRAAKHLKKCRVWFDSEATMVSRYARKVLTHTGSTPISEDAAANYNQKVADLIGKKRSEHGLSQDKNGGVQDLPAHGSVEEVVDDHEVSINVVPDKTKAAADASMEVGKV